MRRLVMLILGFAVLLFPPYYLEGWFSSDWGWMFITDAFPPFAKDIWWLVWIVEFLVLFLVNYLWKSGEARQANIAGQPQGHSASVAAQPKVDVATELGKLNELRQSGALTEEEFAEQKARLLGNAQNAAPAVASAIPKAEQGGDLPSVDSEARYDFPTQKIANAYAHLREKGVADKMIVGLAHKWLWQNGKPLPPGPYMHEEKQLFLGMIAAMGLGFGLLMTIFFAIMFDAGGIGLFLFFAVGFGAGMYFAMPWYFGKFIADKGLMEWRDIPG